VVIDQVIDKGPCPAGQLEGFVTNKVTGDYFETLLYAHSKILP
jgi:hypothetical protein